MTSYDFAVFRMKRSDEGSTRRMRPWRKRSSWPGRFEDGEGRGSTPDKMQLVKETGVNCQPPELEGGKDDAFLQVLFDPSVCMVPSVFMVHRCVWSISMYNKSVKNTISLEHATVPALLHNWIWKTSGCPSRILRKKWPPLEGLLSGSNVVLHVVCAGSAKVQERPQRHRHDPRRCLSLSRAACTSFAPK